MARTRAEASENNSPPDDAPMEMVTVTQGIPPVSVRVNEGNQITHEEQSYAAGDVIQDVDGPLAMGWESAGHVTIL